MANYRIVIELFFFDENTRQQIRENDTTLTFSADTDELARAELLDQTRHCLLKKGQPKDVCYRSYLYSGHSLLDKLESRTPEETATARAFFTNESSESFPKDGLQKRMRSGGE